MKGAFIRKNKEYTTRVRFSSGLYSRIIDEAVRLGLSQECTVRHIVIQYFDMLDEKNDQGGGA